MVEGKEEWPCLLREKSVRAGEARRPDAAAVARRARYALHSLVTVHCLTRVAVLS
jgi:hypothetical protein